MIYATMPFQKILINTRFCIKCEMLLSLIMGDYRGTSLLTSFFSLLLSVEILFTIQLTKKNKKKFMCSRRKALAAFKGY